MFFGRVAKWIYELIDHVWLLSSDHEFSIWMSSEIIYSALVGIDKKWLTKTK